MIRALPDLLSSSLFSSVTTRLRADLDRSAMEAVTGTRSDVTQASGGKLGQVHRVRNILDQSNATQTRLALVTGRYTHASAALKGAREAVGTLGVEAITNAVSQSASAIKASSDAARSAMGAVVTALNARFDGRSLFAGAAAGQPALAPAEAMLSEIGTALSVAPDAASKRAALDAYFAPGGGFEASAYGGADSDAAKVVLPDGTTLPPAMRADSQAAKDLLKGLAFVVHGIDLPPMEVVDWVRQGADLIRSGTEALTLEEARLGTALKRLGEATEREADGRLVAAETLDRIVGRDAYEAASETQRLETRLEAAYTLTSRLGRLSLTNFLR
ncbi:flagellin [Parvularcula oceani]|uniref:flagellin n=1 Tax=Parvularcula oceani TaxID=1247963 RepID=UPI0004E1823A|nr:flagellin [Parvularcula oceani]